MIKEPAGYITLTEASKLLGVNTASLSAKGGKKYEELRKSLIEINKKRKLVRLELVEKIIEEHNYKAYDETMFLDYLQYFKKIPLCDIAEALQVPSPYTAGRKRVCSNNGLLTKSKADKLMEVYKKHYPNFEKWLESDESYEFYMKK